MSNPDKFCVGTGGPKDQCILPFVNNILLNVDGHFARDLDYQFVYSTICS